MGAGRATRVRVRVACVCYCQTQHDEALRDCSHEGTGRVTRVCVCVCVTARRSMMRPWEMLTQGRQGSHTRACECCMCVLLPDAAR